MRTFILVFCVSLFFLFACRSGADPNGADAPKLHDLTLSTEEGGEPNLFKTKDGTIYLSWIEYLNDSTDALQFAKLLDDQWTSPQVIAKGSDWFVNWADFPSIIAGDGQADNLVAHWLQKRAEGTYDYDVHISQSQDGGQSWSDSFIPHRDSIAAEHGFVSLLPLPDGQTFATWLDGRNTKSPEGETDHDDHGHGHHGAMTLRTATFDMDGNLSNEAELDDRICDCCQTSAALTDEGVVVVYRDRSENEVRDISIVRQENGSWTEAQRVHKDNWEIAGCPVNGPVVVADKSRVVVAWFTMEGETGLVKLAFSNDNGRSFAAPLTLSNNTLGRVDLQMLDTDEVIMTWIEKQEEHGVLKYAKVHPKKGIQAQGDLLKISTERQSGFPKITALDNSELLIAWTAVDEKTMVKTAKIQLD